MSTTSIITAISPKLGWPSLNTIRHFIGNFGGLVIPELKYGFASKVLFTPGYVVEDYQTRKLIRLRYLQAGFKHFPLNLYNTVPIYPGGIYPPWDDRLINNFLDELLGDGLIPGGSCFSDGVKTIKPVVDPDLVPWVITGWENPNAINKPAQDADNLFYVARQYFKNSLIYWENPIGEDLPYVNPPDWGAVWVNGKWSDVNPQVWNYMVQSGCQGICNQGTMWESIPNSVANLKDYVERVINGGDGWVKADLIDFEECVAYNTEEGAPRGLMTGEAVRVQVPQLTGYCNG